MREIAEQGGVSHQAVSKHKTYLVSSAKLVHDGESGLSLNAGVTESDWQLGDFTKGLPSPDQVREWWAAGPDGAGPDDGGRGQGRGQRGQTPENGPNADTYGDNSVYGERGQSVDTSTESTGAGAPTTGEDRGRVHGLSTGGMDSENGIGKPNTDTVDTLSTVSTGDDDDPGVRI